jgi:integrase
LGLKTGEVLKIRPKDIKGRIISIQGPKSDKAVENALMPESVANRLQRHIARRGVPEDAPVFKLRYSGARKIVKRLGGKIGVDLKPHELRKHSATYASRNSAPLEIISKVILRHRDLRTTQIYLGKVSDTEAIRWLDVLYGK